MRSRSIWPNGPRYLWTDAFGVVLLMSLYHETNEHEHLAAAEDVVARVYQILGRPRGIRIGEAYDRYGQYFHYLAMWMYALHVLGDVNAEYRRMAVKLVKEVHPAFVVAGRGVIWKMREDLSEPDPMSGWGALDPFHGYVVYRQLDSEALAAEIADMAILVEQSYGTLNVTQDLGLGMMLWFTHFAPTERWAVTQRDRCLSNLERLWRETPGYFARDFRDPESMFAFTNYGVSVGLQSIGFWSNRVKMLNSFFESYRSGDHYDTDGITHVMACASLFPGRLIQTRAIAR